MESKILELERLLGNKFEDWTEESIIQIVNSEETLALFTPEVIIHLIENRTNDKVKEILIPVKYGFYFNRARISTEDYLKDLVDGSGDQERFEKGILELKDEAETGIERLVYYLPIAHYFKNSDYNLSEHKDQILKDIAEVKTAILTMNFEMGFELIVEMLDVIFSFRENYFYLFQEDIMKDDEDLAPVLGRLNEMTEELMQHLGEQEHVHDEHCNHDHEE
jgi:hypothetical protein